MYVRPKGQGRCRAAVVRLKAGAKFWAENACLVLRSLVFQHYRLGVPANSALLAAECAILLKCPIGLITRLSQSVLHTSTLKAFARDEGRYMPRSWIYQENVLMLYGRMWAGDVVAGGPRCLGQLQPSCDCCDSAAACPAVTQLCFGAN